MEKEINEHYATLRDNLTNTIKNKFDTFYDGKEDDLKPLIEFITYTNKMFERYVTIIQSFESARKESELFDKSIENVISSYEIKKVFDLENANKFLVNGLIMVIIKGFTFDGVIFTNGNLKISKNDIVKKEPISDEKLEKYKTKLKEFKNELKGFTE